MVIPEEPVSNTSGISPGNIAWRKFRRNPLSMSGAVCLIFAAALSVFAYPIIPDDSEWANRQVDELAKAPPGTSVTLWMKTNPEIAENQASIFEFLFFGKPEKGTPIPLFPGSKPEFSGDTMHLITYDGMKLDVSRVHESNHIIEHTYLLGADSRGRDMLSRMILGGRVSLSVGFLAVAISILVGMSLGAIAGFFGGWTDSIVMWFVSVTWSIPTLLLAISLTFISQEKSFWVVFTAIGLSMWVEIARIVRGRIFELREEEYVEAAKALGYSQSRSLLRHVLPNVINPVLIVAAANFATAILLEAGLSFLGFGVQSPVPSWGGMIREGYANIIFESGKWLAIFPGLAIVFVVISLHLVGLGLRDALDPRLT